jgi:hypothetical protein
LKGSRHSLLPCEKENLMDESQEDREPLLSPVEIMEEELRVQLGVQAQHTLQMLVYSVGTGEPGASQRALLLIQGVAEHFHEMLLDVNGGREPIHVPQTTSTVIETFGAQLLERLGPIIERFSTATLAPASEPVQGMLFSARPPMFAPNTPRWLTPPVPTDDDIVDDAFAAGLTDADFDVLSSEPEAT